MKDIIEELKAFDCPNCSWHSDKTPKRLKCPDCGTVVNLNKFYQPIEQTTTKEEVKLHIVDNQKHPVDNGSGGDHVSDFFIKVKTEYSGNPLVDVKHYINSNERLSLLKVDDKTVAIVAETRTEFNHVEFVFAKSLTPQSDVSVDADRWADKYFDEHLVLNKFSIEWLNGLRCGAENGFLQGHTHAINSQGLVKMSDVVKVVNSTWCPCDNDLCDTNMAINNILDNLKTLTNHE